LYVARTWTVLEHQPNEVLRDYDLMQPCNVRMEKLAMMVDLAGEVGVVLLGRLEHNLCVSRQRNLSPHTVLSPTYLGAIGELVRR
jgi:hypothetical protein